MPAAPAAGGGGGGAARLSGAAAAGGGGGSTAAATAGEVKKNAIIDSPTHGLVFTSLRSSSSSSATDAPTAIIVPHQRSAAEQVVYEIATQKYGEYMHVRDVRRKKLALFRLKRQEEAEARRSGISSPAATAADEHALTAMETKLAAMKHAYMTNVLAHDRDVCAQLALSTSVAAVKAVVDRALLHSRFYQQYKAQYKAKRDAVTAAAAGGGSGESGASGSATMSSSSSPRVPVPSPTGAVTGSGPTAAAVSAASSSSSSSSSSAGAGGAVRLLSLGAAGAALFKHVVSNGEPDQPLPPQPNGGSAAAAAGKHSAAPPPPPLPPPPTASAAAAAAAAAASGAAAAAVASYNRPAFSIERAPSLVARRMRASATFAADDLQKRLAAHAAAARAAAAAAAAAGSSGTAALPIGK